MVRSFFFRMSAQGLVDLRGEAGSFFGLFRESPLLFALQRINLLHQASDLPALRLQVAQPVPSTEAASPPGPLDAPISVPLADEVDLSGLLSGTAIAFIDGRPQSPADALPPEMRTIPTDGRFQVHFLGGFDNPMIVDMLTRTILPPGATGTPLGNGTVDTLLLTGPLEGGGVLPAGLGLDIVALQGGANYDLAALDSQLDSGGRLILDARDLGDGDSVRFDAAGEREGGFDFFGGAGDDSFIGGAGNDRIEGGAGGDSLRGGAGADVFLYNDAVESSGADHDSLLGFDPSSDRIDLPVTVSGFSAAVTSGTLSAATFDTDLAAALAGLGAGRAGLFTPTAGDLAGTLFLVVDANGEAGYQAGEDFVFALPGAGPTDLGASTSIFI